MVGVSLALTLAGCPRRDEGREGTRPGREKAAPLATQPKPAETFQYTVESFADLRILRYQVPSFEGLSLRQKQLLYYLYEAALSGREITYDQHFEHNLAIRRTLEAIVTSYTGDHETPAYNALLTYAKRVWFSSGIHHHYSSKKFVPEGISPTEFAAMVRASDPKRLPLGPLPVREQERNPKAEPKKEDLEAFLQRMLPIIFDPNIAEKGVNKDPGKDPVRDSANHFYVNLTRDEVVNYTKGLKSPGDATPVEYGLNSQLVKLPNGVLEERVWRVDGMYGAALAECVRWLELALGVAETPAQAEAIAKLIAYYKSGDLKDWDRFSIAWVADTDSKVDLIHGFIETYGDAMDLRATYESIVQLEDAEATKRIKTLSGNAQWFEDHSPIQDAYKKKNVVGVSARVIQAVVAAGDTAPPMPSGVNLPNSNWIRQKHGSKSVTLGNIMAAYDASSRDNGVLEEFASGPREVARAKAQGAMAQALMVDMHEVIGHASGQLAPGVGEVSETLRQYSGTLEEGRADLVALYYILDPKLVELKVMPSLEVGRAAYDSYIRGGLLVQMSRVPLGENLEEAHMRNRQLIAKWAYEQGKADNVIERVERGGKTFVVVQDYVRLRKLFGELLKEIQRIKSEGDFESARDLVETHGVQLDEELHKQVRERYQALKVAPYAGFIQPELVPVKKGDEIVDVHIEYPTDFVAQQLRYAARYSFLPTYN
ncbi:MAG: hypothetical protein QM778_26245 [Myxococcales bacterium]